MARKDRHSVLVAGAGPAGLAAALFLRQRGVDVEVVDERWEAGDDDFHVILHPDVVERLDDAGARLDLAHAAHPVDTVVVHDGTRRVAALRLHETAVRPGPAAVLPLRVVRDSLEEALRQRQVKVARHRRLARVDRVSDRVAVEVDVLDRDSAGYGVSHMEGVVVRTARHEPTHLIAADGFESVARQQLGVGWRAIGAPMATVAFEFASGWTPGPEAHVYVGDAVAALWPAPHRRLRLTFQLPASTPLMAAWLDARHTPDRADLAMMIDAHLPWVHLPIGVVSWSQVQWTQVGVAERASVGAAWLLGEAAHQLSPLASHSLNHGIRVAHDLAATIDEVARDQGAGERLAHQAARARAQTLRLAELGELFQAEPDADPFVAANLRRIVPALPAAGLELEALARSLRLSPKPM